MIPYVYQDQINQSIPVYVYRFYFYWSNKYDTSLSLSLSLSAPPHLHLHPLYHSGRLVHQPPKPLSNSYNLCVGRSRCPGRRKRGANTSAKNVTGREQRQWEAEHLNLLGLRNAKVKESRHKFCGRSYVVLSLCPVRFCELWHRLKRSAVEICHK